MSVAVSDVSAPVQPDWNLAQILVVQGLPTREIVAKCNLPSVDALHKRMSRGKWTAVRTKAASMQSVAIRETISRAPEHERVSATSVIVRQRLAEELKRTTEGMERLRAPKSVIARALRAQLVRDIADAAKPVFGWDSQSGERTLDLHLLKSAVATAESQLNGNLVSIPVESTQIPQQIEGEQRLQEPLSTPEQAPELPPDART